MKNKELTIIIPCFNAEKFLNKCIDSILNQKYNNFDLILINDCSTDNTLNIIKSYKKKYDFIKVINNSSNMGAGYSRNRALEITNTKYVTFIDSDDYIEPNYISEHMKLIKKENADISICDLKVIYANTNKFEISQCCDKKFTKKNIILSGLAASPCNKVFKRELFNDNLFAEGIMNEDIPAVIYSLIKSDKICYVKDVYYNYIQRDASVQNSKLSLKKLDIFKSIKILENRISNKEKDEYLDGLVFNQIILILFYVVPKEKSFKRRNSFLKNYSKLIQNYNILSNEFLIEFLSKQGKKHKIYYNLLIKLVYKRLYFFANILITIYRFYQKYFRVNVLEKNKYTLNELLKLAKFQKRKEKKSISVIIPNYNYERFLIQRVYSILNQEYAINELIILDDNSTDNSKKLITEITDLLSPYIDISVSINDTNSGSAFKQWKKGIDLAKSDYIWICEADDYANKYMLKNIFKSIDNDKNVRISYVNTGFIDKDGYLIQRNVNGDVDLLATGHWNKDYVNDGLNEIKNYEYLNCTIANVSSVVFKNDNYENILKKCMNFKQAGDWLFYYELMKLGKVAFTSKTCSYYRIHGNNVTTTNKKNLQFEEIQKIHQIIINEQSLNKKQIENIKNREEFLKDVWKL